MAHMQHNAWINKMPTLETLISEINKKGYRIYNLFELIHSVTGKWQANLNKGDKVWEFGHGDTPNEALSAALLRAENSRGTTLSVRGEPITQTSRSSSKELISNISNRPKANAEEIEF